MSNTLTADQLLDQAFGSNTSPSGAVQQALDANNQKPSKAMGVNISVINQTKADATLFLGSAFSIDIGFLEPYQFDKGLPQQNGESLKAQIFHLSIQRQHEEFTLMKSIADSMLANSVREYTINWNELDAEKYPFTLRTWKESGMTWHFVNRKMSRPSGEKLTSDKVSEVLAKLL